MVRWTLFFASPLVVVLVHACSGKDGGASVDASTDPSDPNNPDNTAMDGGPTPIAPGPPRVSYLGRIDTSDAAGPRLGWSDSQVIVRFDGTALSVKIAEGEDNDGGSRYDIVIDGQRREEVFAPGEGTNTYEIAKDLAAGTHLVVISRRTEPQVGISQFLEFTFPGGGKLLAPPSEPGRHVEIVGDSEMTGYGIECGSANEHFSADTQNSSKAYPALVAKSLSADVHNVSYSGKGIWRNESGSGALYGTYYPQAVPRAEATPWDFTAWKADVIWIGLGANDFSPEPGPVDVDAFGVAYRALISLVRKQNPDSHVIFGLPALVNDDYPEGFQARTNIKNVMKAIVDERKAAGDAKFYLAELPIARENDLQGCDSHPTAALHAKLAPIVAAKIREITGWK